MKEGCDFIAFQYFRNGGEEIGDICFFPNNMETMNALVEFNNIIELLDEGYSVYGYDEMWNGGRCKYDEDDFLVKFMKNKGIKLLKPYVYIHEDNCVGTKSAIEWAKNNNIKIKKVWVDGCSDELEKGVL